VCYAIVICVDRLFANQLAERIMIGTNLKVVVQQLLANVDVNDHVEEAMVRGTMFVMVLTSPDLQEYSATVFLLDDNPEGMFRSVIFALA